MTEDEMVGWHHQLNGYEFEKILGGSERQGSLVCCSPWDRKKLVMNERLNRTSVSSNRGSYITVVFTTGKKNLCTGTPSKCKPVFFQGH